MLKGQRIKVTSTIIYIFLTILSLGFVTWIARMSYENTYVELQEEFLSVRIREEINNMETSLNFGKQIDKYYGMDDVLAAICDDDSVTLNAVVLDKEGDPLYVSMEESEEGIALLSNVYSNNFREKLFKVSDESSGSIIQFGNRECLVFPINKDVDGRVGYMIVVFDKEEFVKSAESESTARVAVIMIAFIVILSPIIGFFVFLIEPNMDSKKWYAKNMLVIIMMAGILGFILYLYTTYTGLQSNIIDDSARMTAEYICVSIDKLRTKGLSLDDLDMVSRYIRNMLENNKSIESIAVVKSFFDTASSNRTISLPISDSKAYVNFIINQGYLESRMNEMKLMFGAVFVICLMITFEISHIADIVTKKVQKAQKPDEEIKTGGVSTQIRLLSFMTYTALYTSMPYAAVIMRNWRATLFGFSESVSASLPLTVELVCVLVTSLIIQKIFRDSKLKNLSYLVFPILILCNLACARVSSPYFLLMLRALSGIGFAFLKYWLNSFVAAGSADDKEIQQNYAELNGGLLCGITIGASLGSAMAASKGYQFNYYFTSTICLIVFAIAIVLIPWKEIDARRLANVDAQKKAPVSVGKLLTNKGVLMALLVGDIPLNIGLMYVVSFLPVYMSAVGQSGVVTSYAYLINGVAGVYVGVILIKLLKRLSTFAGSVITLLMGAAGILVLILGGSTGVVLISAAIMGLFDGYGTPTITGFFTGLKGTEGVDKAAMLTLFSSVGSATQILCPVLYNVIIQPDGQTTLLAVFGLCFAGVAALFFVIFKGTNKLVVEE